MYISLSIVFDPGLFDKLSLIAICNDFVKHWIRIRILLTPLSNGDKSNRNLII